MYYHLDGPLTAAARQVHLKDGDWIAPVLWRSEFRNVLVRAVRRRELSLKDAGYIQREAEIRLHGAEFAVASETVIRLAAASGCSAYDCEFVALAQDARVPLVTSDREIVAAFPDTAMLPAAFTDRPRR